MNADPETLVFFPRTRTPEESIKGFEYEKQFLLDNDYGLWAAQEKSSGEFMGFVGIAWLQLPTLADPSCREIGWRLAKRYWGNGYATEAALAVLDYAIRVLQVRELYSITSELNLPSINVMRKKRTKESFFVQSDVHSFYQGRSRSPSLRPITTNLAFLLGSLNVMRMAPIIE